MLRPPAPTGLALATGEPRQGRPSSREDVRETGLGAVTERRPREAGLGTVAELRQDVRPNGERRPSLVRISIPPLNG